MIKFIKTSINPNISKMKDFHNKDLAIGDKIVCFNFDSNKYIEGELVANPGIIPVEPNKCRHILLKQANGIMTTGWIFYDQIIRKHNQD